MAGYKGNYKWSYDPRTESLAVWEVDSAARAAMPQHFDVTGGEGYLHCSQGRLTVDDGCTGVIYADRPMLHDKDGQREAQRVARILVEDEISETIDWNLE